MIIQFTLKNDRTNEVKTQTVDDSCSPSGGYNQAYAQRTGREYASGRAIEVMNSPLHPLDTWTFMSAQYQPIPHFKRTF